MNDVNAAADLKRAWDELRRTHPRVRERDAAAELGVSEAELVATRLGDGVIRLKPDWHELLRGLEGLGEVMAITRNDVFVHEKVGHYRNFSIHPATSRAGNSRWRSSRHRLGLRRAVETKPGDTRLVDG